MRSLLVLALLAGCVSDEGSGSALDHGVLDAAIPGMDVDPATDVASSDAASPDSRPADVASDDAVDPDTTLPDSAPPDAARLDAEPVDRGVELDQAVSGPDADDADSEVDASAPDISLDQAVEADADHADSEVDAERPDAGHADSEVDASAPDAEPTDPLAECLAPPRAVRPAQPQALPDRLLVTPDDQVWTVFRRPPELFVRSLDPAGPDIQVPAPPGQDVVGVRWFIGDGAFVVLVRTWDGETGRVHLQRLGFDGEIQGLPVELVAALTRDWDAVRTASGFGLLWRLDAEAVRVQRFDLAGEPLGDAFAGQLTRTARLAAAGDTLAYLRDDRVVIIHPDGREDEARVEGLDIVGLGADDFAVLVLTADGYWIRRLSDGRGVSFQQGRQHLAPAPGGFFASRSDFQVIEVGRFDSELRLTSLASMAAMRPAITPVVPVYRGGGRVPVHWAQGGSYRWAQLHEERCNGLADDCDAQVDELVSVPIFCETGRPGACAVGQFECAADGFVCASPDGQPEVCNDLDDDCDGVVDEDLPLNACGSCGPPPAEICNRLDDDCDGAADEGCPCGNGQLDPGEACDDGNVVDGDGCDALCQDEDCGDGVLDPGEECDDGNRINEDGCTARCEISVCGNGILEPLEMCDDGNQVDDDECDRWCEPSVSFLPRAEASFSTGLGDGLPDEFRLVVDHPASLTFETRGGDRPLSVALHEVDEDLRRGRELRWPADDLVPPGNYEIFVSDGAGGGVANYEVEYRLVVDASEEGVYGGAFVAGGNDGFVIDHPGGQLRLSTSDAETNCPGQSRLAMFPEPSDEDRVPVAEAVGDDAQPCAALDVDLPARRYLLLVDSPGGAFSYTLRVAR